MKEALRDALDCAVNSADAAPHALARTVVSTLGITREMVEAVLACANDAIGAVGAYDDGTKAYEAVRALTALLDLGDT